MLSKKEIRKKFRDSVFKRDGYKCAVCGFKSSLENCEKELDAHHITSREKLPNGGYVKENGISLCDPSKNPNSSHEKNGCHWNAELVLLYLSNNTPLEFLTNHDLVKYMPDVFYSKIKSSYDLAHAASLKL